MAAHASTVLRIECEDRPTSAVFRVLDGDEVLGEGMEHDETMSCLHGAIRRLNARAMLVFLEESNARHATLLRSEPMLTGGYHDH